MILVVLIIGTVLLVAAFRNTYGALFAALATDIPHFVVWGAAIVALGAVGFIPGLKPISRGLLALVIIVLIFQNYAAILAGFQAVSVVPKPTAAPTPANSAGSQTGMAFGPETGPSSFSSDGEGISHITVNGGANG